MSETVLKLPEAVTRVRLSFGPAIYIEWPTILVVGDADEALWQCWDVWDPRGHPQGAHRILTGVPYDRAVEVARASMDLSPQAALLAVADTEGASP